MAVDLLRTFILALVMASLAACGDGNQAIMESGKRSPTPPAEPRPATSEYENNLAEMRSAGFSWVFIIRRRDGGEFNTEDRNMIRAATTDANRRVMTDGGKAVIVGSNFAASLPGIESLKGRFEITDLSPAPSPQQPPSEKANANSPNA
jgi:hypothetical protein